MSLKKITDIVNSAAENGWITEIQKTVMNGMLKRFDSQENQKAEMRRILEIQGWDMIDIIFFSNSQDLLVFSHKHDRGKGGPVYYGMTYKKEGKWVRVNESVHSFDEALLLYLSEKYFANRRVSLVDLFADTIGKKS